jgi:regulatory protein YycI of two-component signal transduction system YycFG
MNNNSNPTIFIVVIAIVVLVFGYVLYAKIKRRGASWSGTVIDKDMVETATSPTDNGNNNSSGITFGTRNAVNRSYKLRIKDDAGKEFNWPVGQGFYDSVNVGDKLTKSPGTETPTKL